MRPLLSFAARYGSQILYQFLVALLVAAFFRIWEHYSADLPKGVSVDAISTLVFSIFHTFAILAALILAAHTVWVFKKKVDDIRATSQGAVNAGLYMFWEGNESQDTREKEGLLKQDLSNLRDIKILGATGYATFGEPNSFLHESISNASGDISIVLLDPEVTNQGAQRRARSLGVDFGDYRREIVRSIEVVKDLNKRGRRVYLYFYHHLPQWKLYLTEDKVLVQFYEQDRHVADCPIFGFRKFRDRSTHNFYDYFSDAYSRLCRRLDERGHLVDLNAWKPPSDI